MLSMRGAQGELLKLAFTIIYVLEYNIISARAIFFSSAKNINIWIITRAILNKPRFERTATSVLLYLFTVFVVYIYWSEKC